jgi:hypothetical protein
VWIWSEKTAAELHVREEASRTTTSSLRQQGNCGENGQAPTSRYELVTRDVTGLAAHLAIQTVHFHARRAWLCGLPGFYRYWLLSAPCQSTAGQALLEITYHALRIPYDTALGYRRSLPTRRRQLWLRNSVEKAIRAVTFPKIQARACQGKKCVMN